jgi:hypothetical protein
MDSFGMHGSFLALSGFISLDGAGYLTHRLAFPQIPRPAGNRLHDLVCRPALARIHIDHIVTSKHHRLQLLAGVDLGVIGSKDRDLNGRADDDVAVAALQYNIRGRTHFRGHRLAELGSADH